MPSMSPQLLEKLPLDTSWGIYGAATRWRTDGDRVNRGKMMFKDKYKAAKENEAISASLSLLNSPSLALFIGAI